MSVETEGLQMTMNDMQKKIGAYWDRQSTKKSEGRYRWWLSPTIIRHINYKICGEYLDGFNAGALKLLKEKQKGRVLESAISVGCGNGRQEMELLEQGLVKHISCYELSEICIEKGKRIAQEKGLSDRIIFHLGDFYESEENREEFFDMVFWNGSLHHMLDVEEAVKISHKILRTGGIFFCNDYVGASRFQWSDLEIAIINGVRASMPDEIFQNHNRWVKRPDIERMKESDYSEAADAENIIPSIKKLFNSPRIINTGGTIYHPCLNDILKNIPEDSELLEQCLSIDDDVARHGFWQYAFILAEK